MIIVYVKEKEMPIEKGIDVFEYACVMCIDDDGGGDDDVVLVNLTNAISDFKDKFLIVLPVFQWPLIATPVEKMYVLKCKRR